MMINKVYRITALVALLAIVTVGYFINANRDTVFRYFTLSPSPLKAVYINGSVQEVRIDPNAQSSSLTITRTDGGIYNIYFANEIKGPLAYVDLLMLLPRLNKSDTVVLNLSGYGGDVAGTMPMMSALRHTKAKVIANVTGNIYSAHAYLTCSADEIVMRDETMMMFHMSSAVRNPSIDEYTRGIHRDNGEIFLKKHCSHLISEVDVIKMGEGMDLYYTPKDIKRFLEGDNDHKFYLVD